MYLIRVYDRNDLTSIRRIITDFAEDITLSRRINSASELSFSLYYRDPNLYDEQGYPLLKYNTLIELIRVRRDGSYKSEGFFYIKERSLKEEFITFRCYGAITRLNDYIMAPNLKLKDIAPTLDLALKYCLFKHVILRTWTWKQDWDNCPYKDKINTSWLSGKDYGDAVCLDADTTIKALYDTGYLITEGISIPDYDKLEWLLLRIKATWTEETDVYFSYDVKTLSNPNWQLNPLTVNDWKTYHYEEQADKDYMEILIPKDKDGSRITDIRVGVVLHTSNTTEKTDLTDKEGIYGLSPVLYAIQLIGIYNSEFSTEGISPSLNTIETPEDISTSNDTKNLSLLMELLNRFNLEITTDTFIPKVEYDSVNKVPVKIGTDRSGDVILYEGEGKIIQGNANILSAPIEEDCSQLATILYAYGSGSGFDQYFIKVVDTQAVNDYGEVYGVFSDSSVYQYEDLQKKANDEYEKRKKPKFNFTVDVIQRDIEDIKIASEPNLVDIELGDYITYFSELRGIADKFRVIEIRKGSSGQATLSLETKSPDLLDTILYTVFSQKMIIPAPTNLTLEGGVM